jgi:hypothetical protein
MENSQTKISKWIELKDFYKDRIISPLDHPEYILYFILIVIGFGAISIWYTIYTESMNDVFNHKNLINSIASFSVAIMASGSIELMFAETKAIKITLFFTTLALIIIGFLLFFTCVCTDQYLLTILFALGSLFIWWIANAANANLTKDYFVEQSEESEKLNHSLDKYNEPA